MKLKKILVVLLSLTIICSFAACGKDEETTDEGNNTQTEADANGEETSGTSQGANSDSDDGTGSTSSSGQYGTLIDEMEKAEINLGDITRGLPGTVLSNEFFDWKVNSVKTETTIDGESAGSGKKYVIVNISVTNTTDEEFDTGNYDFIAYMAPSDEDGYLDSEYSFYDDMYPDEDTLAAGKTLTGDLVFIVDDDVDEIVVDYTEFWSDDTVGNTYWIDILL